MRLLSIDLENIRSYRKQKVEFMDGISLFEGDIGSGKSSILNAIEFALFGLGDLKGSHLLRVGEQEGRVELELEINGRLYVFSRTLRKKGQSVGQDSCYIIEEDVRTPYSATNMKKRVLQLLDFKESSNPLSHSVIYRFAVFTPQEAMKEVLGQKPQDRKQTLRKAFGIEEYNTAAENTSHLVTDINVDMRVLKQSEEEIESITKIIGEETDQIGSLDKDIQITSSQITTLQGEKTSTEALLGSKRKEVEKYTQIKSQLEIQKSSKTLQTRTLEQEKDRGNGIKSKLDQSIEAVKTEKTLEPDYNKLLSSREKRRSLEPKKQAYTDAETGSKLVLLKIESEKERLEEKIETNTKQQTDLIKQVESIDKELEKLPDLTKKKTDLELDLKELPILRGKDNDYTGQISEEKQNLKTTQKTGEQLAGEWKEISSIGLGAQCPRCQQTLSENHYKLLETKYTQETQDSEKEAENINEVLRGLETEQAENKTQIKELEAKEKTLRKIESEIQSLVTQQEGLEGIQEKIKALEQENTEIKAILENEDYAQDNRTKLSEYLETINLNKEDASEYDRLKTVIDDFEAVDIERKYLESKALADRKQEFEQQQKGSLEEITKIEGNLKTIDGKIKDLTSDLEQYDDPEKERDSLQTKVNVLGEQIAGHSALVEANTSRITEAENRIEGHKTTLQRHLRKLDQSQEYGLIRRWLEEAFIPSIHSIEQNVFRRLHNEFNRLFVKWFKTLLESEDIEGYIDEDFTPIIDQSGYELDIASLSGGEKTSVALAYRLALNTIVKQVTDTMKNNLLILDEPTDGFSREQLYKMRDILHDLNCEQVIIVSHENELENVADHVYKVHKQGTVSTVMHP